MTGLSIVIAVAAWIAFAYWRDKRAVEAQLEEYRRRDQAGY